jgi:hypothetical protein
MDQLEELIIIVLDVFTATHFHFECQKYFPSVLYDHPEFRKMLILCTVSIFLSGNLVNNLLGKDLYLIKKYFILKRLYP